MVEAVLEIQAAAKRFGGTEALAGVGLCMDRGEWLGLLGPNGAGKTTLVRAIYGRVRLDRGTVRLFGAPVQDAAAAAAGLRARIGVVPQEIALYPLLTGRENLNGFGALSGLGRTDLRDRVDWALEFTGLQDRADELVRGFSGGMKRRLNIACSVLHRPELILLDEPTVGVDPQSRERIWEMLGRLHHDGASILLTTHQLDEAQQVCRRIVILDKGQIIADGSLEELIAGTVGRERVVTLVLDGPVNGDLGLPVSTEGRQVTCRVGDVAATLPSLLQRISALGRRVDDIEIESPSLHSVFLHLTGRELRE